MSSDDGRGKTCSISYSPGMNRSSRKTRTPSGRRTPRIKPREAIRVSRSAATSGARPARLATYLFRLGHEVEGRGAECASSGVNSIRSISTCVSVTGAPIAPRENVVPRST